MTVGRVYNLVSLRCEWPSCEAKPRNEVSLQEGTFLLCQMHTARVIGRGGAISQSVEPEEATEGRDEEREE